MAQAVGDVIVALRADIGPFQRGMRDATRSMRDVEERGRTMGSALGGAAGGVSNLNSALSQSRSQLTAVQQRINSVVGATDQLETSARSSAQAFQEFDRARTQVDNLRASIDPLFAASKQYEAAVDQLNNALRLGVVTQGEYDAAITRVGQAYLTAGGQAAAFGNSMRASSAHTTNLMFQFQDIAVMLAAGQNPLILAMQQGMQVSGVFQQMKNSGQSAFSGIIGGLRAMLSPMSFLTIGTIAGGAALVQWGVAAYGARERTLSITDAIKRLEAAMSELDAATLSAGGGLAGLMSIGGRYTDAASEIVRLQSEIATIEAGAALRDTISAVSDISGFDRFANALATLNAEQARLQAAFGGDTDAINRQLEGTRQFVNMLASDMGMSADQATQLVQAMEDLGSAQGAVAQADAAARLREQFEAAVGGVNNMTVAQRQFFVSLLEAEQVALRLRSIEERRTAVIEETRRALSNQINLLGMINQFGEESVEVSRFRAQLAREEYEARLRSQGIIGQELQELMALYTVQENLTSEAQRTADAIALIQQADLGSFEAQVRALAAELGIAADEARRLLNNMPVGVTYGDNIALSGMSGSELIFGGQEGDIPEGRGRSGGASRDFAEEFEAFQGQLMTETERLQSEYDLRLEQLREFRERRVATEEEFNEAERRLNERHANQMRDLELQSQQARLSIISGTLGDIAGLIEATGNRNLNAVKALRTAEAVIDGYSAAVAAWRQGMSVGGPALAAVYTAGSLARTGALIAQIQSSGRGGAAGGGGGGATGGGAMAARPTQNIMIDMINASPSQVMGIQNLVDMLTEANRQGYDLNALVRAS